MKKLALIAALVILVGALGACISAAAETKKVDYSEAFASFGSQVAGLLIATNKNEEPISPSLIRLSAQAISPRFYDWAIEVCIRQPKLLSVAANAAVKVILNLQPGYNLSAIEAELVFVQDIIKDVPDVWGNDASAGLRKSLADFATRAKERGTKDEFASQLREAVKILISGVGEYTLIPPPLPPPKK